MKINVKWNIEENSPIHYIKIEKIHMYNYIRVYIPGCFVKNDGINGFTYIEPYIEEMFDKSPLIMSFYA